MSQSEVRPKRFIDEWAPNGELGWNSYCPVCGDLGLLTHYCDDCDSQMCSYCGEDEDHTHV